MTDDAVRLRIFSFSWRDKAKALLNSLPPDTIATWKELAQKFLTKYYPHTQMVKLRNDIVTFTQFGGGSLYETWERYKGLLKKCQHHNFQLGSKSKLFTTIWGQLIDLWLILPPVEH